MVLAFQSEEDSPEVPEATFEPAGLAASAAAYRTQLLAKRPPQPQPVAAAAALKAAAEAMAAGQGAKAVAAFEQAITLGEARAETWLRLSEAWMTATPVNPDRAVQSAWNAHQSWGSEDERRRALLRLADLFEGPLNRPKDALAALEVLAANNGERPDVGLQSRIGQLRQRVGLDLRKVRIDAESDQPRICLDFSAPVKQGRGIRFEDFLKVEPAVPLTVDVSERSLCLSGVAHGADYTVTVREGLPGSGGLVVRTAETRTVRVGDRKRQVAFRGNAFILPRSGPGGVPVTTVNLDAVAIAVYRINDRNLAPQVAAGNLLSSLSEYSAERIAEQRGERIWQGRMAVANERNKSMVTALAIRDILGTPRPGLYVVTAKAVDVPEGEQPYQLATQWLMISDIGLTAIRGADGINAFVRSFATAEPRAGVKVALVAANNAELARGETDAIGRVRFTEAVSRGKGGNAPALILAYGSDDDFAILDLTRAAFDLTDRGVGGRANPGPLDAFLYADRGVYRPGETVNVTALVRDGQANAVENLPLTLKVLRPSGTQFHAGVVKAAAPGAHVLSFALTRSAPLGTWQVQAFADPKGDPIGKLTFQVEEFVPERLAVEVTPSAPWVAPGQPFDLAVKSRFLYGPPAAGLSGSVDVSVAADADPFPGHKGYRFGLAQETLTPRTQPLVFPASDDRGLSRIAVSLPALADTTKPLKAEFRIAVAEPGGRPSRETVAVPVRHQPFAIGIRPRFADDRIAEGGEAQFDVIAVDAEGKPVTKAGLQLELFAERVTYQWYMKQGTYNYRTIIRSESIRKASADVPADRPALQAFGPLDWGRYRIEVSDAATGVATSVRFAAGWEAIADAGETPDKVRVTADKAAYRIGETARVRLVPPFAGKVLLTIATDRLLEARNLTVPAEGTTVDVPVNAAWGAGAYVTATVYRPPVADRQHMPVRAIGLTWLAVDPAARTLKVNIETPSLVRPRQTIDVPLRVTTADGAVVPDSWVTLAAVDEGILQLTDFASPDPAAHYFGKRLLGVDMRDDYGRLIDALSGPHGALRQGGDQGGLGVSLPAVPLTIVSLFSGPVKTDASGSARIPLAVPDFNGRLRLIAVAFDHGRVGAGAQALTVRDPLVAELILPRFLAPGDDSRATLSLHNVEAEAGRYRIALTGEGGVAVSGGESTVELARDARSTLIASLQGTTAGIGTVRLAVDGPGGVSLRRQLSLTVRPSRPVESTFQAERLAPAASWRGTAQLVAAYLPGTSGVRLGYSSRPPFDMPGLLAALDRYPYGCLEQVISRALPLLVVDDVELALGRVRKPDDTLAQRITGAIGQVLDKQRYDGAFGTWSAYDEEHPWLSAYAMEFLTRARAKGHPVAEAPFVDGLEWLRRHAIDGGTGPEQLASRAYALHVLALAGVATPGAARYLHDAFLDRLPTPLSRAQLSAALSRLGDSERARVAAATVTQALKREVWPWDFGSTVRDAAAIITVLGEVQQLGDRLPLLIDRLPASEVGVRQTNTQEQAWLVMAANALIAGPQPLNIKVTGLPQPPAPSGGRTGDPLFLQPTEAELAAGVQVANLGASDVWQAIAVSGVPVQPPPAAREGLRVRREFFHRNGQPLNLEAIKQNDVFVIIVSGEAASGIPHQALLSHGLPAGWEIENARLGGEDTEGLAWLGEVTDPVAMEARDDRFIAAVDLSPEAPSFRLAYLVRAVTPGQYELPGALLEDMYKPRFFARQATGRITVHPAP
jgi:hypothetical protein